MIPILQFQKQAKLIYAKKQQRLYSGGWRQYWLGKTALWGRVLIMQVVLM